MATIFTSELLTVTDNKIDIETDQISTINDTTLMVEKYSSLDEFIDNINPRTSILENGSIENKTRIRVLFDVNQVDSNEKVKLILNTK